jgi:hypothetical protein
MAQPYNSSFYLGRSFDLAQNKALAQNLLYDPADLTTHGVIIGMTGSGKTGLGIAVLEEAALQGIPAIIIDPKGDLTNLLLHFPDLLPQDFKPWLDPEAARRAGSDLDTLASDTAAQWRNGLAAWALGTAQLQALQSAAHFTVFTPGSSAGQPVNILSSFQAPGIPWDDNREVLREKIATIVTALLGLIGLTDIDPLRSREHILLSNLLENAWSQGHSLDLSELILQVQTPPFDRLGAFPVENFFPGKDRMDLAMLLNNFLASPSFQNWLEGQPLDVNSLMYSSDNLPCHNIFYLAHLSDSERMFFVTLLLAGVESWMRTQRGTSGLRALVYFDEIAGYLPPVANPPSRPILLRMLKQARAFGLGLLLTTQNPVDLDYKALSNAGTWLIGRLQTDQDKQRLLDGLQGAGGSLDRPAYDKLISNLRQRVFLYHSVHLSEPQVFQSRWTLNFLAGPLTRAQIPDLNRLAGQAKTNASVTPVTKPAVSSSVSTLAQAAPASAGAIPALENAPSTLTRPAVPSGYGEYFIPNELGVGEAVAAANLALSGPLNPEGILYRPALLAQAEVRYLQTRYNLEYTRRVCALVRDVQGALVHWEDFSWHAYESAELQRQPLPQAHFTALPGWLSDVRRFTAFQKDFIDWVFRTSTIRIRANEALKVYAGPQISEADYRNLCSQAAGHGLQIDQNKIASTYDQKISALEQKITNQQSDVKEQQQEVSGRRMEEAGADGQLILSIFSKRKRSLNTSFTKHRLAQKAASDLEQERQQLQGLQSQLADLQQARQAALQQVQDRWTATVNNQTEIPLNPARKDLFQDMFGVAWLPYYLIRLENKLQEIPAYKHA